MKKLGILCHVTSLINRYGLGDFGVASYDFINFLKDNNLNCWQILPLNNANSYNCPYGTLSSETFDEMFVDLDDLISKGLLTEQEVKPLVKKVKTRKVDYNFIRPEKLRLFTLAFSRLNRLEMQKLDLYAQKNPVVFNYAYYKTWFEVVRLHSWRDINKSYWNLNNNCSKKFIEQNKTVFLKYVFFQKTLFEQWAAVKKYANSNGIKIIGDLPIYNDKDSVDVFLNHKNYLLTEKYLPVATGGTPPDGFNKNGQDWGTCVWNWEYLEKTKYEYLINRIVNQHKKYDCLRLDHFPGLVEYFANSKVKGVKTGFYKGGGFKFFYELSKRVNTKCLVAEDLFAMTQDCLDIKKQFGLRGMNVIQFAFDTDNSNPHLPQNVLKNTIYYLGTHDNNTFMGFLNRLNYKQLKAIDEFLGTKSLTKQQLQLNVINSMFASKSDIIVLQAQDFMFEGEDFRMNIPGVAANCWEYRLPNNYKFKIKQTLQKIRR